MERIPLADMSTADHLDAIETETVDPRELNCKYALVTSLDPVLINVTPHVVSALQDIQQVRGYWNR